MRAVNLLPPDRKVARSAAPVAEPRKTLLVASGVLGIVVVAGLSTALWSSTTSIGSKKKQLEALQSQIASIPTPSGAPSSDTSARAATIQGIVSNRMEWDGFMNTLSKVVPEDVWLQNFQITTAGAAAAVAERQAAAAAAAAAAQAAAVNAAGRTPTTITSPTSTAPPPASTASPDVFTVSGYTYSHNSVARMMRRLDIVPWLSGVTLVSSTKSAIGNTTVFQFTLKGTVVPTPGGAG